MSKVLQSPRHFGEVIACEEFALDLGKNAWRTMKPITWIELR